MVLDLCFEMVAFCGFQLMFWGGILDSHMMLRGFHGYICLMYSLPSKGRVMYRCQVEPANINVTTIILTGRLLLVTECLLVGVSCRLIVFSESSNQYQHSEYDYCKAYGRLVFEPLHIPPCKTK